MCPSNKPTLENVIREHGSFIRTKLRQLGVVPADIEDVEQEVLLGVSRGLAKLDPEVTGQVGRKLRGWLFGICRRQAASYRRSQARRAESLLDNDVFDSRENGHGNPEDQLASAREMAFLLKLVACLPRHPRAVFVAYEIEETPIAEIAMTLSIPENTAWNHLRLARGDLVRALRSVSRRHFP